MIYDRAEQIEEYLDRTGCDWEEVEAAAMDRLSAPQTVRYAEPVTVSARFTMVFWVVTVSCLLGVITGFAIGMTARPHPVKEYHPAPWSCAHELALYGPEALYPICGTWKDKP